MKIDNINQEEAIKLIYVNKIPNKTKINGKKTFIELSIEQNDIDNLKLEISNSITKDLPPKPKFNIKLLLSGLNLTRMDINGYHTNPEFEKEIYSEILDDIYEEKTRDKMQKIMKLMEKYSEYIFKKDDYHIHFYINLSYIKEDIWAFPIHIFNINKSENIIDNIREFCQEFNIKLSNNNLSNLNHLKGISNEH